MLKFYFNGSPNPTKVALFLEEGGLAYEPIAVDTRRGQQFTPEFLAVNPNAKVPAIDDDGVIVFDSNAILLYLAKKTGKCIGAPQDEGELLSWLLFIASGLGPFSGQAVHFQFAAPQGLEGRHVRHGSQRRHSGQARQEKDRGRSRRTGRDPHGLGRRLQGSRCLSHAGTRVSTGESRSGCSRFWR